MISKFENRKFYILNDIKIGGIFGKCQYNGQIDIKTAKPHGLGLVVTDNGEKICEGFFKNGYLDVPHLHINKDSTRALIRN